MASSTPMSDQVRGPLCVRRRVKDTRSLCGLELIVKGSSIGLPHDEDLDLVMAEKKSVRFYDFWYLSSRLAPMDRWAIQVPCDHAFAE